MAHGLARAGQRVTVISLAGERETVARQARWKFIAIHPGPTGAAFAACGD